MKNHWKPEYSNQHRFGVGLILTKIESSNSQETASNTWVEQEKSKTKKENSIPEIISVISLQWAQIGEKASIFTTTRNSRKPQRTEKIKKPQKSQHMSTSCATVKRPEKATRTKQTRTCKKT